MTPETRRIPQTGRRSVRNSRRFARRSRIRKTTGRLKKSDEETASEGTNYCSEVDFSRSPSRPPPEPAGAAKARSRPGASPKRSTLSNVNTAGATSRGRTTPGRSPTPPPVGSASGAVDSVRAAAPGQPGGGSDGGSGNAGAPPPPPPGGNEGNGGTGSTPPPSPRGKFNDRYDHPDYHRRREAEKIEVPAYPQTPMVVKEWKVKVCQSVQAASGRG